MPENTRTWGYILRTPRTPTLKKQLEILAHLRLDTHETGPVWRDVLDKIPRGPKTEETVLAMRGDLLEIAEPGDCVAVASPACLGVSAEDARAFILALQRKGVRLMVWDECWSIQPDGDPSELIAEVKRRHNREYQRRSRAKARKRKSQS
jgi:hypothetical protein